MNSAQKLNEAEADTARELLRKCCAADKWTAGMLAARPFRDDALFESTAADVWWSLTPDDWQEAFAAHPRIGDVDSLRAKYADTKSWSADEQSGVDAATDETLAQLAAGNHAYFEKFGYIFIVCATGKSAEEMLRLLNSRLNNSPEDEIRIAAAEQLQITLLRLRKLNA
jgi:OHCU decarboxylase